VPNPRSAAALSLGGHTRCWLPAASNATGVALQARPMAREGYSVNVAAATIPVASPSLPDKAFAMNSATTLTTLRWIVQIAALRPVIQWRRCAKAWRNVSLQHHGVDAKSCAKCCRWERLVLFKGWPLQMARPCPSLARRPHPLPSRLTAQPCQRRHVPAARSPPG